MRTSAVFLIFLLLPMAHVGSPNVCLADCRQRCESETSAREVDSRGDSLKSCGAPNCCLLEPPALPGADRENLVRPSHWTRTDDDSARFGAIRFSQRIARATRFPVEVGSSCLFSLHCAFLI
jgi:hypothetical protein